MLTAMKKMPRDAMFKILYDIANALDYAHKQDIIHRDVKPSNIIVKSDGHAVLTDFGLALNAVEGTIGNTFGSVHYIAPEQAISSAQSVAQSDQYSMGIIVYEMLTGRVPFDDPSAMSVALSHISDSPPLPSKFNADISKSVERVMMKALDKEPQKRFDTIHEFIQTLEATLVVDAGEPEHATTKSVPMANLPKPKPSTDDDSPTIIDTKSRPVLSRSAIDGEETSRTGLFIAAALIGLVFIVGALFLVSNQQSLVAANETSTAVAEVNMTGTTVAQIAIDDTATADWIEEQTATAEATMTAEADASATALFVANQTATQEARDDATATGEAQIQATADAILEMTRVVEAVNMTNTASAEDHATQTAESRMTRTAIAALTQTARAFDQATQSAIIELSFTPTSSPTRTPIPTASQTPSSTPLPSNTPAPSRTPTPGLIAEEGEAELLLRYDGRNLVIGNRSQAQSLNLSNLVFVLSDVDEEGNEFEVTFRLSSISPASNLRVRRCLQLLDNDQFSSLPTNNALADDLCVTDPFWQTTGRTFWLSDNRDAVFEVRRGSVDVITRCPAASPVGTFREQRCTVSLN